jgi:hypothetical protein
VRGGRGRNEGIVGPLFITERDTVGIGVGTAASVRGFFLAPRETVCGVGRLDPLAVFLAVRTASSGSRKVARGGDDEVTVITSYKKKVWREIEDSKAPSLPYLRALVRMLNATALLQKLVSVWMLSQRQPSFGLPLILIKSLGAIQQCYRLRMLKLIPERDFSCASKLVPLEGCPVLCLFGRVRFASSAASAPVLRFVDPLSLFQLAPVELKYECIGSSPDMDGRGPMEVHGAECSPRDASI